MTVIRKEENRGARFMPGDIVGLKSGGPPMVVGSVRTEEDEDGEETVVYGVWWFTPRGKLRDDQDVTEAMLEARQPEPWKAAT
jgi:uncharacterized protein YodC (DUF2158 family)